MKIIAVGMNYAPVSYTHLDVYKRQRYNSEGGDRPQRPYGNNAGGDRLFYLSQSHTRIFEEKCWKGTLFLKLSTIYLYTIMESQWLAAFL